jgi:hypothetical protein
MGPPMGTPGTAGFRKGQKSSAHAAETKAKKMGKNKKFESGLTPEFGNLGFSPSGMLFSPDLHVDAFGRTPFSSRKAGVVPIGFTPAFDRRVVSTPMSEISIASNLSPSVFASPNTIMNSRRLRSSGRTSDALNVLAEASARKAERSTDMAGLDDFDLSPSFGAHNYLDHEVLGSAESVRLERSKQSMQNASFTHFSDLSAVFSLDGPSPSPIRGGQSQGISPVTPNEFELNRAIFTSAMKRKRPMAEASSEVNSVFDPSVERLIFNISASASAVKSLNPNDSLISGHDISITAADITDVEGEASLSLSTIDALNSTAILPYNNASLRSSIETRSAMVNMLTTFLINSLRLSHLQFSQKKRRFDVVGKKIGSPGKNENAAMKALVSMRTSPSK